MNLMKFNLFNFDEVFNLFECFIPQNKKRLINRHVKDDWLVLIFSIKTVADNVVSADSHSQKRLV